MATDGQFLIGDSGEQLMHDDGSFVISDGAGDACCCGCPGTACEHCDEGETPDAWTISLSGVVLCTGCQYVGPDDGGTPRYVSPSNGADSLAEDFCVSQSSACCWAGGLVQEFDHFNNVDCSIGEDGYGGTRNELTIAVLKAIGANRFRLIIYTQGEVFTGIPPGGSTEAARAGIFCAEFDMDCATTGTVVSNAYDACGDGDGGCTANDCDGALSICGRAGYGGTATITRCCA